MPFERCYLMSSARFGCSFRRFHAISFKASILAKVSFMFGSRATANSYDNHVSTCFTRNIKGAPDFFVKKAGSPDAPEQG
jgi:hypothetical protein